MSSRTFMARWVALLWWLCLAGTALAQAQSGGAVWGYKVKPGDRLIDIAKTYQKKPDEWKQLQQRNGVTDPKLLTPGKQLNIPVGELKQGNPVAEAVLVHGDVQRLDKTGQPVGKLSSGDILKMGERLQTGARSTLTIRFADDSRMLVTEKSTVDLTSLVNYGKTGMADTKVQVLEGGTDSQVSPQKGPASRYEIGTPAINLAVRGTGFRIQVDGASGATRTEVGEGLVAGTADGQQALIGRGFGLIAEPGKPLGQPQALLPAPQLDVRDEVIGKLPVQFAWQALAGAKQYRLQLLARVQGAEAIIEDALLQTTSVQWDDLPDGDYLLRIRGVHASGLEGLNAVQAFALRTKPTPPTLLFPSDGQRGADSKVSFRWDAAPEAHTYRFQIAEDEKFAQVVAMVPNIAGDAGAVLLALAPGRYFWRVASVTRGGIVGPYSEAFQLVLQGGGLKD